MLDPRTHAVRGDLADVRLAELVFAPHYAAPMDAVTQRAVTLFARRGSAEPLVELGAGDAFEVLELAGDHAWGLATAQRMVGYVDRAALEKVVDGVVDRAAGRAA